MRTLKSFKSSAQNIFLIVGSDVSQGSEQIAIGRRFAADHEIFFEEELRWTSRWQDRGFLELLTMTTPATVFKLGLLLCFPHSGTGLQR